jgi:hypothetical protein
MQRCLWRQVVVAGGFLLFTATALHAQTTVTLPNTSGQTTTLTANVSEQAKVTVPAGVTFDVNNINISTAATAVPLSVESIVLSSASKRLKISLQANAASFTAPGGSGTTWSAGDVTWNAASWTNATGVSGTLGTAFSEVATCTADAATCSTTGLVFTLGAKPTVNRSGSHTIVVTWKFESI